MKFKDGFIFWIWVLVVISVWVFAFSYEGYKELNEVNSWDTLTASGYNQLLANVRDLNDRVLDIEWNLENTASYSTGEVFTGNYWLDGKKIYKKTINFGKWPTSNSSTDVAIKNLGIDYVPNIKDLVDYKWFYTTAAGTKVVIPYSTPNHSVLIVWYLDSSYPWISLVSYGLDMTIYSDVYATIYYTKTTD
jgi:hypothetical protein